MRIANSGDEMLEREESANSMRPRAARRLVGTLLLGVSLASLMAAQAAAQSRTISMYHVHTKERITVTYWKDGRFVPSALRKLNWFLRDWRKDRAVRIDPRTIDLIWKLHADLGSRATIHVISGHRSAATNAMLRRIGRRVARRSRHITGQAVDFKFPDVPAWKVRNLALAYGIGGVGYYGRNGFIHVDTGNVRHWPRIPRSRYASIVRKYRGMIGRGWKNGSRTIMVAARGVRASNFNRNARHRDARPAPAGKPIALPGVRLATNAAGATPRAPLPKARPYQVLVLAASRMEITPAAAPATLTNFARPDSTRDPIGVVIANLPERIGTPAHESRYPRVRRDGKSDLATALVSGDASGVPTLDSLARHRSASGKGDLLLATAGMSGQDMIRRNGAPYLQTAGKSSLRATTAAFWPALRPAERKRSRIQRVNRAEKGDLLTTAALPPLKLRKAAFRYGALRAADMQPLSFR